MTQRSTSKLTILLEYENPHSFIFIQCQLHKVKKKCDFLYSKHQVNFELFLWGIKLRITLIFLKSEVPTSEMRVSFFPIQTMYRMRAWTTQRTSQHISWCGLINCLCLIKSSSKLESLTKRPSKKRVPKIGASPPISRAGFSGFGKVEHARA